MRASTAPTSTCWPAVDVEFGEHAVAGRGDGVLHLHGLQPDQRLARRHLVADGGADPDHRARHRRQQRPVRDGGVGVGEAGQRGQVHRSQRRVDEHVDRRSARRRTARSTPSTRQHHPVRRRRHQGHVSSPSRSSSRPRREPVGAPRARRQRRRRTPWSGSPTRGCASRWAGRREPLRLLRLCAASASAAASADSRGRGRVGQRRGQLGQAVGVEERGVGGAVEERRMAQHVDQQVAVGADAVQSGAGQRVGQDRRGLPAGRRVGDDLGQHRVVEDRHHRPVDDAGVDADARAAERA